MKVPKVSKDKIISELKNLENQAQKLLEAHPEDKDLIKLIRESSELREALEGEFNFRARKIVGKKRALRKLARKVEAKYGHLLKLNI